MYYHLQIIYLRNTLHYQYHLYKFWIKWVKGAPSGIPARSDYFFILSVAYRYANSFKISWANSNWCQVSSSCVVNVCAKFFSGYLLSILWKTLYSGVLAHDEVYLIQHYINKVCPWLATGRWFTPGTPISSNNKTDRHDII
jgi:hypothetical protein